MMDPHCERLRFNYLLSLKGTRLQSIMGLEAKVQHPIHALPLQKKTPAETGTHLNHEAGELLMFFGLVDI